jgi:hypothetical protein
LVGSRIFGTKEENVFSGTIPSQFGRLAQLRTISLGYNKYVLPTQDPCRTATQIADRAGCDIDATTMSGAELGTQRPHSLIRLVSLNGFGSLIGCFFLPRLSGTFPIEITALDQLEVLSARK